MKPTLLITILIVLATQSYAQKQNNTKDFHTTYWAPKWRITELTNPVNHVLQFGLERRMNKNALELQLGYSIPKRHMVDSMPNRYSQSTEGYSIRTEARRYLGSTIQKGFVSFYAGAQLFYTYYTTLHFQEGSQSGTVKDWGYIMPVHTYGAAILSGYNIRWTDNFLVEFHIGIGMKRKILQDIETHFISDVPIIGARPTGNNYSYNTYAIPINMAVGYTF